MLTRKPRHKVFTVNPKDLDWVHKLFWNPALDINIDPKIVVLSKYYEFFDKLFCQKSDEIPFYRAYNYHISLKERTKPFFGPLYDMSREKNEELCKYLFDNLDKGFIRASQSLSASPVLFAEKARGGLWFCVNYCNLIAITVKNWYPLPLITETLNQLSQTVICSKFDAIAVFNCLRIAKKDEWKTTFCTHYGLFEYVVLPFGFCNGLALFQHYINDTLRKYLDIFCTAYLNDILIYSNSLHEHRGHVKIISERLKSASLFLNVTKCEFHITKVSYLGFIISTHSVKMDLAKIKTILEWLQPTCLKDMQSFLGFANFYRRFIYSYSTLVMPLVNLTKKNTPWSWTEETKQAFDKLQSVFISDIVLLHYNPELPIIIETDASDYISAEILSQYNKSWVFRPIAYYPKKHNPAKCNCEIYNKELMAIVRAFEHWRLKLESSAHLIKVVTDHKNLEYFITIK